MNIEFDNTGLEELYTLATTKDHRYKRLSKDIVNALIIEISKHYE